ncbi:hypothetical protein BT69DRAFT_1278670 [Atractiella rhizophila]|nr:hypothetical protein BT69DRAFT_1278670 [Atractiella rhizophila]
MSVTEAQKKAGEEWVKKTLAAGEFSGGSYDLEAYLASFAPDATIIIGNGQPPLEGRDAFKQFFLSQIPAFESVKNDLQSIEVHPDKTIVVNNITYTFKGTGDSETVKATSHWTKGPEDEEAKKLEAFGDFEPVKAKALVAAKKLGLIPS